MATGTVRDVGLPSGPDHLGPAWSGMVATGLSYSNGQSTRPPGCYHPVSNL